MKKVLIVLLLLINYTIYSQTKKDLPLISISSCCKLGFNAYDKEFNMYQNPFILKGGKKYKIRGYDNANYSGAKILSTSPNKRFIVMDYISKGYVDDGTNKTLYENYLCVIVDVVNRKVVMELQTDCGGKWDKKNRWINDGKVIF
ncbi:hypothetical protein DBR39_00975 [Chryseobacterium sp. KBW03]|jgi:hypothetical protein|uniref:hypothetical protein n=1 Tax=Chryseobacterium sp. KBW03 TaxID=2153362 RepID=UPI000F5A9113|nr:hypothetical protein [Chryseobacterium sp. KBW03]RQO42480.1 hypothetical protein DBR39_00975 [Chryseobacterium sp. KBW03]